MIAVVGGKGGCGKTTTTLGLAAALARQRKPVLAADADREMPNLHAMAGVARCPGLDAVAAGWPARMVAGGASAAGLPPGVRVLPAASGPASVDSGGPGDSPGPPGASDLSALTRLRGASAQVLLDAPAGAGPDAVAPLRVADAAVVVTTATLACARDAAKTAAMARELGTPVAGGVVSRASADSGTETELDATSANRLEALLDCPILGVVPEARYGATETPFADARVRAAHDDFVSALQPKYL